MPGIDGVGHAGKYKLSELTRVHLDVLDIETLKHLSPGDRWEAALYGRNITDERYLADCKTEDPSGTYVVRYEPPARWGLEFVTRF